MRTNSKHQTRSIKEPIQVANVYAHDVQRLLTYVYVAATRVAQELDRILLDVDVLLKGLDDELPEGFGKDMQIMFRIQGGTNSSACLQEF